MKEFCRLFMMLMVCLIPGALNAQTNPCPAPTGITVIGTEERDPGKASFRVQVFGDARHLADEGEPLSASGYFTSMFDE